VQGKLIQCLVSRRFVPVQRIVHAEPLRGTDAGEDASNIIARKHDTLRADDLPFRREGFSFWRRQFPLTPLRGSSRRRVLRRLVNTSASGEIDRGGAGNRGGRFAFQRAGRTDPTPSSFSDASPFRREPRPDRRVREGSAAPAAYFGTGISENGHRAGRLGGGLRRLEQNGFYGFLI
jgi:hypothetical protein